MLENYTPIIVVFSIPYKIVVLIKCPWFPEMLCYISTPSHLLISRLFARAGIWLRMLLLLKFTGQHSTDCINNVWSLALAIHNLFKECLRFILHGDLTSTTWGGTCPWMTTQSYRGTRSNVEYEVDLSQDDRFVRHTATVFRFLDKCVEDLDNPGQTFENFRHVTKIHAIQGLGIKDFVIIKGPTNANHLLYYQQFTFIYFQKLS